MAALLKTRVDFARARLATIDEARAVISQHLPGLSALPPRERMAAAKRVAFAGVAIAAREAEEIDLAATELSISAIMAGVKYKSAGSDGPRALAALIAHRRSLLGLQEPVVLAKDKKRVTTDTATLCVTSEAHLALSAMLEGTKPSGRMVLLETGADGYYTIEFRLVDGSEPGLADAEMRKLHFMSPAVALEVTGPGCWFGASEAVEKGAFLALRPGRYALQVYTKGFVTGIIAVLARDVGKVLPSAEPIDLQG